MKKDSAASTLNHLQDERMKLYGGSILVGILTGFVVVFYRLALSQAAAIHTRIYAFLRQASLGYTFAWFFLLVVIGVILGKLIKGTPMIKGSGIPQVKGVLLRQLKMNWLKELVLKFCGGVLAIGGGLSLGREGPSIQLGAEVGAGLSKTFRKPDLVEKYLITSGASAGVAAAFNAPLAGVIFALEELHRNFSPVLLTCVMGASLASDYISRHFFGLKPVFDFTIEKPLPLNNYAYIVLLGILAGLLGALFNLATLKSMDMYARIKKIQDIYKPILPLLMAGVLGFVLPEVMGGGHELIEKLSHKQIPWIMLGVLIIVKFLFTIFSFGSGVPGGIFLPMLVIGSLLGKMYGDFLTVYLGMDSIYTINFIVLAMAAYFTAVVRAPITGSILSMELVGSLNHLLSLVVVCMTAYIVTEFLGSRAIYDLLLEKMLKNNGKKIEGSKGKKVIMTIPVCSGSEIEYQEIRDIQWPKDCLIVAIERGEKEIIPRGNVQIYPGDLLVFLTNEENSIDLKPKLISMGLAE